MSLEAFAQCGARIEDYDSLGGRPQCPLHGMWRKMASCLEFVHLPVEIGRTVGPG
jgi:hypothetical protein